SSVYRAVPVSLAGPSRRSGPRPGAGPGVGVSGRTVPGAGGAGAVRPTGIRIVTSVRPSCRLTMGPGARGCQARRSIAAMPPALPDQAPFVLRAQILTPLAAGGSRYESDGVVVVKADGRIGSVGPWQAVSGPVVDLRPWLVLPGLVDLHVHLPQVPHAGLGFGTPLLDWLRRYVFPLEHDFTEAVAEVVAPAVFRAFAAAGTTTALMYGAVYEPSLDAAFRAAEAHGIRAIIGKVMMDRLTYDESHRPSEILDLSLGQSADLCDRWT